jgi:hypothetical protein
MVNKSKLIRITVITLFLFSLAVSMVGAQYTTEQITNVNIGSDGTFTATQSDIGVSYQITGTAGATGTVTADIFNDNPQPTATTPSGISLTSFIAIAFDMNSNDFTQAIITINYTDAEVQNINTPYTVYKYDATNDSYIPLPSTVDTNAKTITVTLNSISDPLLAIGGATKASNHGNSGTTWILVTVSVVLIVVAVVVIVKMMRPSHKSEFERKPRDNDDDNAPPPPRRRTRD